MAKAAEHPLQEAANKASLCTSGKVRPHILRRFDRDLENLEQHILDMGGAALQQLVMVNQALLTMDEALASQVMADDQSVDDLETLVDEECVSLLIHHQPVADDLRTVVCSLRSAHHLERIGDYAGNIAERVRTICQHPPSPLINPVVAMGRLATQQLHSLLEAYRRKDGDLALVVRNQDVEVDACNNEAFQSIMAHMMLSPQDVPCCVHLLFVARNYERLCDHITDVAENIHYLAHGTHMASPRPKADMTRTYLPGFPSE
ncbi:MAG: phosphate signaling complex protein PhoU [Magnetococcales bacterium]|nr:phosphate signaling complex protein PhoU [Magnetococcales bacterium]